MHKNNELTAAMLLNAFNSARLYYAIKGQPEPEPPGKMFDDILESWEFLVSELDKKTTAAI